MRNYWNNTKFADWIRGTPKGEAKSFGDWKKWKNEAKLKHPIRYWLSENGLNYIQNIIYWPYEKYLSIKYYIYNRWVSKTHVLSSKLKKGSFYEFETRLLECMFNSLVDFIEIEEAWMVYCQDGKKYKVSFNPFRRWRCPEAGIDALNWAANLGENGPPHQIHTAKELLILYHWWKEVRPNRPDPYDISGSNELYKKRKLQGKDFLDFDSDTDEEAKERLEAANKATQIQNQYDLEDEEMMIRLIKIRQGMWT